MTIAARLATLEQARRADAARLVRWFEDQIAAIVPDLIDHDAKVAAIAALCASDATLEMRLIGAYITLGRLVDIGGGELRIVPERGPATFP